MIAIEVKGLSKVYKLYQSPTQRLKEIILRKPFHTDFVALDNINFSILSGETFGIIGENGAGKSTLLKILAKTLQPTAGSIEIRGRTAALLELGAGFNPELTGEENIYLNAYLLGLSRNEIDAKKKEIIAFSELGDFIKRPVKTYSSGMHVRLAFSIATSVNPEVLIIDEALSVGDEHFQKKCTDIMAKFRESGKTLVFCSHSMYYVQELCRSAIWIHKGEIKSAGETGKVIIDYQNHERDKTSVLKEKISNLVTAPDVVDAGKTLSIFDVKITNKDGFESDFLTTMEAVTFSFKVSCKRDDLKGHLGFALIRNDETMCFGTVTSFDNLPPINLRDGQEYKIKIKTLPLLTGIYSLLVIVADEIALHPYDTHRTKNFSIGPGRREFGMALIEHEWIIN